MRHKLRVLPTPEARRIVIQQQFVDDDGNLMPHPAPEKFTCFECAQEYSCRLAWDKYNTGGDCLANK